MKRTGIFILLVTLIWQAFSQEVVSVEKQPAAAKENKETLKVTLGDEVFSVADNEEGVKIRLGDQGLTILESLEGGSRIRLEKYDDDDLALYNNQDDKNDDRKRSGRNRFKGNWAGIELGFNNFMTADYSTVMPDDIYFMTLHSGKSNNFSINFVQNSIGFTRHIGLVTGLGFEWNNYRFDGDNSIEKNSLGEIVELDPAVVLYPDVVLKKSRLKTIYLNVPLLLQLKIPADHNSINIAGGVIGGVKLWSQTKMVTDDDKKIKSNSDFSLSVLRWGPTARVGFGNFQIFATYYMTPMFKASKGPGAYDLFPCEIGFSLSFND